MINEMMNSQPKVSLSKVLLMLCLSAAIVMGSMPCKPFVMEVKADTPAEKTITGLGTGEITHMTPPSGSSVPWNGDYVYFGKYEGNAMKYRALSILDSNTYGNNYLLLDCDNVLTNDKFDGDSNIWAGWEGNTFIESDIQKWLKGNNFYNNAGVFSNAEKGAIINDNTYYEGHWKVGNYPDETYRENSLTAEDPVFLLDARSVINDNLGYLSNTAASASRIKKDLSGNPAKWWLRSKSTETKDGKPCVFSVESDGSLSKNSVNDANVGVSPALTVNLARVLFSSEVEDETESVYKLTLASVYLGSPVCMPCTRDGNKVTISYLIPNFQDCTPTQLSVVVTKNYKWDSSSGWIKKSKDAKLLQYAKLDTGDSFNANGTGTFILDENITGEWGKDYNVYILAEKVNGENETDYASTPVEIEQLEVSVLKNEYTYDGDEHGLILSAIDDDYLEAEYLYGETPDSCSLNSLGIRNVSESPKRIYYIVNAKNRLSAKGSATVTINKAGSVITKAPSAKTGLKYTGQAQALVNSGTATGGTLYYAVTTENTAPAGTAYTEAVPKKTDAGTYYVWYKVTGDGNHKDVAPDSVPVTIAEEDKPDEPEREASKPVLIKATSDAISVEVEEGVEYSVDGGGTWNNTGIFTGLQSDTEYSVIARYAAGGGKEAGKPSEALTVRTLKIVVTPVSTKTLKVSDNEIQVETVLSLEENTGGEGYSVGQVEIPDDVALSLFNSLTEEEQKRVANGAKLTITVSVKESVKDLKDNKEKADKEIKEKTGGTVEATGVMLDMGLFVQVGNDKKKETEPVSCSGKISFTVTVPVEMKNTDGSVTRTYYLVHIHDDGTVEIVSSGTDTELPAETDSFSYWYLAYVDEKKDDGGNSGNPSGEKVTTVFDNQPMAYSEETKGEFRIGYFHEIPFYGKAKPELKLFGDIKVIYDGKEYKATKIKVNKKKCLIRITGLDNADKDTVKAVKKATKGTDGLSFKVNPYYVKDTDTVTPKFKKDGSLKSVKVKINEKDYKAKKDEFTYDETSKTVSFSGKNLNGSCKLD